MTFAEQFESIKNQKTLMVGLLFLLVIVVFWIGLSLFGSQTKFAVSQEMRDLAKPLTPTIKESSLARIEQKRVYSQSELTGFTIYKIIEEKGTGAGSVKIADINYVPPEDGVVYGTVSEPSQGGLSNYLQANPDFEESATQPTNEDGTPSDAEPATSDQTAPEGEAAAQPTEPQPSSEPIQSPSESPVEPTAEPIAEPTPSAAAE